jgi:lipoprotein NlpD
MLRYLCLAVVVLLAAACADHPPVPVEDRRAPGAIEAGHAAGPAEAPAVPREGFYMVKKGDTLRSIAREHGVDFRELAAWNNLENADRLEVGQQLRVTSPDIAVVKPVAGPGQVVVVEQSASTGSTGSNTDTFKREPRGGTVPYSEKALAQARAMDGSVAAAKADEAKPADKSTDKPADKPVEKPAAAEGGAAATGVDWTWPATGKVLAEFAEGAAGQTSNKGVDIGGRIGDPVQAAAAGKVTYVGNLRGYGDFLVVRHNADYISVYAHTSRILVKKDQAVTKGQKIAEVGKSDADQPKLHFEIRHLSKPVDPLKILPARP